MADERGTGFGGMAAGGCGFGGEDTGEDVEGVRDTILTKTKPRIFNIRSLSCKMNNSVVYLNV